MILMTGDKLRISLASGQWQEAEVAAVAKEGVVLQFDGDDRQSLTYWRINQLLGSGDLERITDKDI
jgi:hypothetical protein